MAFILGFIYFAIKAERVKENMWFYGIACGIGTSICAFILTFLFKVMIIGKGSGGLDQSSATIIALILTALSIAIIDHWSGLYWDIERYQESKQLEEEKQLEISPDEMAEIRSLQILRGMEDIIPNEEEDLNSSAPPDGNTR